MDICDILNFRGVLLACLVFLVHRSGALEEQPLKLLPNGGYSFGFANRDRGAHYHEARGTPDKIVRGRFGSRSPANGRIEETLYTAGPRGFRPRGPNVARKYDLSQVRRGPIGRPGDPFFDPNEDPSYEFGFKTPTYQRKESADRNAKVTGHYSFIDDVGERHDVQYTAGKDTGFHVGSLYPDSNPDAPEYRYFRGPLHKADKKTRGKTSVQRGTDGSYRFISGGPDQRRTETKDTFGNVRGSYTFLDDKGKQHTTHYIAGPGIGYRILKKSEEPHYPLQGIYPYRPFYPPLAGSTNIGGPGHSGGLGGSFPSTPGLLPTDAAFITDEDDNKDFPDDVFGAAASGHVKPTKFSNGNKNKDDKTGGGNLFVSTTGSTGSDSDGDDDSDDIFGSSDEVGSTGSTSGSKPSRVGGGAKKPGSTASSSFGSGLSGGGSGGLGSVTSTSSTGGAGSTRKPGAGSSDAGASGLGGSGSKGTGGSGSKGTGSTGSTLTGGSGSKAPGGVGSTAPSGTGSSIFGDGGTSNKPGKVDTTSSTGISKKPSVGSTASSQRPGQSSGLGSGFDEDDDDLFGPSSNVQVGIKKPEPANVGGGSESSEEDSDDDDEIFGGLSGGSKNKIPSSRPSTSAKPFSSTRPSGNQGGNQYLPTPTTGFGAPSRPSTTSATSSTTTGGSYPVIPTQTFGISAVPFPGTHIQHGTIFRNVGNSFIGFPPGVAVRAHVQSIDLFPIDSTNPSPGEAMEKGNLS